MAERSELEHDFLVQCLKNCVMREGAEINLPKLRSSFLLLRPWFQDNAKSFNWPAVKTMLQERLGCPLVVDS